MRGFEAGGLAFVGCIVIGVGIGMLVGHTAAATVIGVGIGFLAMAVFQGRS